MDSLNRVTVYPIYSLNHAFVSEVGTVNNYVGTMAVGQECP